MIPVIGFYIVKCFNICYNTDTKNTSTVMGVGSFTAVFYRTHCPPSSEFITVFYFFLDIPLRFLYNGVHSVIR